MADVFILFHEWGINEYTPPLFVSQGALCHQAFYESLDGLGSPGCGF